MPRLRRSDDPGWSTSQPCRAGLTFGSRPYGPGVTGRWHIRSLNPKPMNAWASTDQRDYGIGAQILREIGVRSMRLLSNNPSKLVAIEGYGLSVTEWLSLEIPPPPSNLRYLTTKRNKLGHVLRGL